MPQKLPKIRTDPRTELVIRRADVEPVDARNPATFYRYKDLPRLRGFGGKLIIHDDVTVPLTFQARWPIEIDSLESLSNCTLRFNTLRADSIAMPKAELYCRRVVARELLVHWLTADHCDVPNMTVRKCLFIRKSLLCDRKLLFGPTVQLDQGHPIDLKGTARIRTLQAIASQVHFEDLEIVENADIRAAHDPARRITTVIKGKLLRGAGTVTLHGRDADIETIELVGKLYFGNMSLTAIVMDVDGGILGGELHVLRDCTTDGELYVSQDIHAHNLLVADKLTAGGSIICSGVIDCGGVIRVGIESNATVDWAINPRIECHRITRGRVFVPQVTERALLETAAPPTVATQRVLRLPTAQEKPPVE